jgi:hypothetical protein
VHEVLSDMIDRVVADGGLASVNHPNFWESVTWEEIAALRDLTFVEVYNGHHLAANEGTPSQPPMEQVWDLALAQGQRVWGLAVDDAHHFRSFGADRANPGRGWVAVNARSSSRGEILGALARGDFYASTGPVVANIVRGSAEIVVVAEEPALIEFVGDGQVVESISGYEARVRVRGWNYLRARISNDRGVAWIQPQYK